MTDFTIQAGRRIRGQMGASSLVVIDGVPLVPTLNLVAKASDIILSAGDMQAESNSPTGGGSVLALGGKVSGKFYFEVRPTQLYATNPGFLSGLMIGSSTFSNWLGQGSNSFSMASGPAGSSTWNGGSQSNLDTNTPSNINVRHRIAVDIAAGKIWLAVTNRDTGAWIGGGDPATGTLPTYTFTPGATPVYIALCPRRGDSTDPVNRNRLELLTLSSEWAMPAPSDFNEWALSAEDAASVALYVPQGNALPGDFLAHISGDLDVEWFADALWAEQNAAGAFTAWELDSGAHTLRYTGGTNGQWILRVAGVDIVIANMIELSPGAGQRAILGQRLSVRVWRDLSSGQAGIRVGVNGVYAFDTVITTSGTPISPPSSGTLDPGNIGHVTQTFIVSYAKASRVQPFIGCVLGASTIASYSPANGVPVASLLRAASIRADRTIKSLALAGETIAQQKSRWQAFGAPSSLLWVMIEVGGNDMDPGEPASAAIARLQDLVDTINATKPAGCAVHIGALTPMYGRLVTRYGASAPIAYAKWLAYNEAISGNGSTPITGVNERVTSHVPLLNDGNGYLLAAYDSGDGIHPNNAGRQIIADAWLEVLNEMI